MKKFFLVLAAAAMMAPVATPQTTYANVIHQSTDTIIVNGSVFHTQQPILNINGRLMVPFREFGERLGSTVSWEGTAQRILLQRQGMYSILYIGNAIIQHGDYTLLPGNQFHPLTTQQSVMDSPALLVGGVTYIPLRAVAQAMGAKVFWDDHTRTATILAPMQPITTLPDQLPPPPPSNTQVIDANRPANYGDFSNTSHFQIISSRQAESRHNDSNDYPFLVVFYNSTQEDSRMIVPAIQDVAQRVGLRIFGVDRGVVAENNANTYNSWLWNFHRENTLEEPAMVLVHSRNNVELFNRSRITQNPTSGYTINNQFVEQTIRNFHTRAETGMAPGAFRNNTNYWQHRTSAQVRGFHQNHEEFIVVLYDGNQADAEFYVPLVVAAAGETRHRIYAVDIDRNPQYRNHLDFLPGINTNLVNRVPMMFQVYSPHNSRVHQRITEFNRPTNVARAVDIIEEFLDNSIEHHNRPGFSTDFRDTSYWRNQSANQVRNMHNHGQEFVMVLFDSNLNHAPNHVPLVISAAAQARHRIYAVDIANNPNYRNQLDFLPGMTGNLNNRLPIMFQVYSNRNHHHTQVHDRPHNTQTAVNIINQFLTNSVDFTGPNHGGGSTQTPGQGNYIGWSAGFNELLNIPGRFTNATPRAIQHLFTTSHENFIVLVYNSNHAPSRARASAIRQGINNAPQDSLFVYGVNIGHTQDHSDLDVTWLISFLNQNNLHLGAITYPTLIHVNNNRFVHHQTFSQSGLSFDGARDNAHNFISGRR